MRLRAAGLMTMLVMLIVGMISLPAAAGEPSISADITIVGGPAVISDDLSQHLESCSATGVDRVAGANRYGTAAEVAAKFGTVDTVLLATGVNYPDALSAGAVGALMRSPILLTRRTSLPAETKAALADLKPQTIVILGGEAVVSSDLEASLARSYPNVVRLAGRDRFATAAAVSSWYFSDSAAVDTVYVVAGDHYLDAMVAGPPATNDSAPILLVRETMVPSVTMSEITRLAPSKIVIVGGSLAVGSEVEQELSATGATVVRVAGSSRWQTSEAAAAQAAPGSNVFLVTAENFPDGLTAAPLANGAPILLALAKELPSATGRAIAKRTGKACPAWKWTPPYPQVGSGKRVIYTLSGHRLWMIDANENLVDTYLVTGRRGIPHTGTYKVYSKSVNAWAPYDGITMKHMVRFVRPGTWGNKWAYGFHSIPRWPNGTPLQTEAELGSYGSGGCIRQADHKAKAMYDWANIGMTVIVLP